MKKMPVSKITLIIISSILGLLILWIASGYNGLIKSQENVTHQKSNIENQLQRRLDLIPNLVNTVKGYASHEEKIFKEVSDARAKLAGASTLVDKATANNELSSAVSRLLAVQENYPNLKADTQFTGLQDELAGTENRIAVSRKDYNDAAKQYNTSIKTFPSIILANMFSFAQVEYFEADQGAKISPKVEF